MRTRRQQQGFTLIELVIVVAFVAILTAIAIPFVIGKIDHSKASKVASPAMEVAAPTAVVLGADGKQRRLQIDSAEVHVSLAVTPVLEGISASTRYWATVRSTLVVRDDDPAAKSTTFAIPFPRGMTEARDVSLRVRAPDGSFVEPPDVAYGASQIEWTTTATTATIVVEYAARGSNAFAYDVTGGGRTGSLRVEIEHPGVEPAIAPTSLEPTARAPGKTSWVLDHVIGERGIAMDLPPGPTPLGRILLMCQLAGGAVLLFGIGFWYLSEGTKPGRLDTFRYGHFMLLALNHVAFFAIFAVLALQIDTIAALAIATVVSQALLLVHASRILTRSFAWTRVLPLSVFTLGLVTLAVYAAQRALVIAGAAMFVVAFVTLTYRRWSLGRDEYRRTCRERAARELRAKQLDEALVELRHVRGEAAEARALVDEHVVDDHLRSTLAELDAALAIDPPPADPSPDDTAPQLRAIHRLRDRLRHASTATVLAARAISERAHHGDRVAHCIACGEPGDPRGAHCHACGVARPVEKSCTHCGVVSALPQAFMRKSTPPLHCTGCGA